jgi:hypothetical protein
VLKAARDTGDRPIENEVPRHDFSVITRRSEDLGNGRRRRGIAHRLKVRAVLRRQQTGENAGVRRQRPTLRCVGPSKVDRLTAELIQKWRSWSRIGTRPQRASAQRIDHQKKDVHVTERARLRECIVPFAQRNNRCIASMLSLWAVQSHHIHGLNVNASRDRGRSLTCFRIRTAI